MIGTRGTPFPGTPSETMKAGYCPSCGGTGTVLRAVPVEGTYPCSTCHGAGTWAAAIACDFCFQREAIYPLEREEGLMVACRVCFARGV